MNLVPKLSLAFIGGVSLLLAVNGYVRVRREVSLFESDRIRDDVQIGKTLAAAVTAVWQTDGPARALSMVRRRRTRRRDASAYEWVWRRRRRAEDHGLRSPSRARIPFAALPRRGLDLAGRLVGKRRRRADRRFTFVPVALPGIRSAARSRSPKCARDGARLHPPDLIARTRSATDAHARRRLRRARDAPRGVDRRAADGLAHGEGAARRERGLRRPPPVEAGATRSPASPTR